MRRAAALPWLLLIAACVGRPRAEPPDAALPNLERADVARVSVAVPPEGSPWRDLVPGGWRVHGEDGCVRRIHELAPYRGHVVGERTYVFDGDGALAEYTQGLVLERARADGHRAREPIAVDSVAFAGGRPVLHARRDGAGGGPLRAFQLHQISARGDSLYAAARRMAP